MRSLDFSDGFESSSAPAPGIIQAASVLSFLDDAAFVTYKGSAAAVGDLYLNTTSNQVRYFDGTVWREEVSGVGNQTIAGNKTFSNDVTITGDLTVNGTTTTVNSTTLEVADATILVNNGGNAASADAQRAGIEVEINGGTNAGVGYNSSLASKFKAGDVGSQAEIATVSHTQTLTNKTIDPANNTIPLTSAQILVGNVSNAAAPVAVTGDVLLSNAGVTSIPNDQITNAKLANVSTQTIKGRTTAATGDPEDLTATQATAILNSVVGDTGTGGTKGLVPAPGAGDAAAGKFLKADGTFAVPSVGAFIDSIAKMALVGPQTIPNATATPVLFDTIQKDPYSGITIVLGDSFYTVPAGKGGEYCLIAMTRPNGTTTATNWSMYVDVNAGGYTETLVDALTNSGSVQAPNSNSSTTLTLADGDVVRIYVSQNSGGSVSMGSTSENYFRIFRIAN